MNKQIILEQYSACYDTNVWFVALRNAIEGLTAEQAAWKPTGADNSVWQTLSHLTFYNYAYLERFKGVDFRYSTDDNDETFFAGTTDEEWATEVARFDAVMKEWRELITKADDNKFDEAVSAENPVSWATLIANVNAHNAYHAGQILLLRKLQGSWNPEEGVS